MQENLTDFDNNELFYQDGEIKNESFLLSYFTLVTDNIRINSKKITRNSFWLITSFLLYVLIKAYDPSLGDITVQFVTIQNNQLLLNLIPVFFSFLFFQNITLWNHNINLLNIFDNLSVKIFSLGTLSDTKNIVRPFSILHHVLNYQYENKKVWGIFKLPLTVVFILIMFFPVVFEIYCVYEITTNNYPSFIPIACGILTGALILATIIQAKNVSK